MIQVDNLVFEYPGVRALDQVSLSVRPREITALVGPNGAGKTTLLRCLAGLETPLAGAIRVNGIDVLAEPRLAHEQIGYLPDFYGSYKELTVRQALTYTALAHNIEPAAIDRSVAKAAERLAIGDRLGDKVGTLSRGLGQRLAIAQACVHEPRVLLLDEPASGLDPEARRALSQLFLALREQGMTLLVSSHILAELEEYSTSMAIVRQGRIIEHRELAHRHHETVLLRVAFAEASPAAAELLRARPEIELVEAGEEFLLIRMAKEPQAQAGLLRELIERQLPVCGFGEERINMQERYLRRMQDAGGGGGE